MQTSPLKQRKQKLIVIIKIIELAIGYEQYKIKQ